MEITTIGGCFHRSPYLVEKVGADILKATGIVRRIDDLGRVVIPKEIRRTLRIREGDPLEIFVDREGGVILKKYSPIGELGEFATEYAESLYETLGHMTIITDRDTVVAVAGPSKKEYVERSVGSDVEKVMEERKTSLSNTSGDVQLVKDKEDYLHAYVVAPIIYNGDPIGSVILLARDDHVKMGDIETKLAETAAGFLSKQMEQ